MSRKSWRNKLARDGLVKVRRGLKRLSAEEYRAAREAERQTDCSSEYKDRYLAGATDVYDEIAEGWHECYMEELIATPAEEREGEHEFFKGLNQGIG